MRPRPSTASMRSHRHQTRSPWKHPARPPRDAAVRMGGSAAHIDALTIGITMEHGEVSTKSAEDLGTAGRRGAPAKIEQSNTRQIRAERRSAGCRGNAPAARAMAAAPHPQRRSRLHIPPQAGLNLALQVSAKLASVSAEHLDAVILRGVGLRRPSDPLQPGSDGSAQERRASDTARASIRPDPCCEACRRGSHHHGSTAARIHPDQHRTVCRQHTATPEAHLQREGWRDGIADPTAQTIRSETDLRRRKGTERMGCREAMRSHLRSEP